MWNERSVRMRQNQLNATKHVSLIGAVGVLWACLALTMITPWAEAQEETGAPIAPRGTSGEGKPKSAHEAFAAGHYDQAAATFGRRAERRPDDPSAQLNLGSALHQLQDYEGAKSAFERALDADDRRLRAKATYDLGNTAYRQGRLKDAIKRYQETLALDPNDEDAKHNLEFVQQELERRQEQAEQRQQQNQDGENSEQQQGQDGGDQESQDGGEGEQGQDGEQGEGDQDQQQSDPSSQEPKDTDGDGLPDQVEREGENPTDPSQPDSDGDGRSDGEEDRNGNGRVDEGESNPNRRDEAPVSDGGSQESEQSPTQDQQDQETPGEGEPRPAALTPEQAERLLAALQDKRPPSGRKTEAAQRSKSAKDW